MYLYFFTRHSICNPALCVLNPHLSCNTCNKYHSYNAYSKCQQHIYSEVYHFKRRTHKKRSYSVVLEASSLTFYKFLPLIFTVLRTCG